MNVYLKPGKRGAKEKQMIAEIEAAIAKKRSTDPTFDFNPADDFEDLKKLHREMVAEDVEFTEHATGDKTDDTEFELTNDKKIKLDHTKTTIEDEFKDPFNEAAPIIRDYVKEDQFNQEDPNNPSKTTFGEPTNFDQAYNIPGAQDDEQIKRTGVNTGSDTRQAGPKKEKVDPVNPSFNDMDKPSKNKQTKRFAKRIVGAVTMLLEKGFVWWTTKNINDAKLAEYELNGEIDLSLLLEMEDGQQATVRQFFASQCQKFEVMAKISKDDQDELAEALADVLMEKGITPTPTQVLIMSSLEIVGRQAITAFAMTAQTNALLLQLKAMKVNTTDADYEDRTQAQNYTQHNPVDHTQTSGDQKVEVEELEKEENEFMNESKDQKVEVEEVSSTELTKIEEQN